MPIMKRTYEIAGENVIIITDIPFVHIKSMEICHLESEHGRLEIQAVTQEKDVDEIIYTDWANTKIKVLFAEESDKPFFNGRVEKLVCHRENGMTLITVNGIGETVILDKNKKSQTFQNVEMTYRQVVQKVVESYEASFIWKLGSDKAIGVPIIQYMETDWEFLKRLSSHFHGKLFADLKTGNPNFFLGINQGRQRELDNAEIVSQGFDGGYFESGCYEEGMLMDQALYLDIKTKEQWQMGDFLFFEGNRYSVFRRKMLFKKGEFVCIYRLGTDGVYYQKRQINKALAGLRLEGVVKKREKESVYIQLDIDKEQRADYPWEWTPETNNFCYCMPEIGEKAVLYLPTQNTEDGCIISAAVNNREKSKCENPEHKEFSTKSNKKIGLNSNKIFADAMNGKGRVVLDDAAGIEVCSDLDISLNAVGRINIVGANVSLTGMQDVVCKTDDSNIEICRDFNFYAPDGVKTVGLKDFSEKKMVKATTADDEPDCWRVSYQALGAIPAIDPAAVDSINDFAGIFACGSIPKVAKGSTTVALSEVMEGKKQRDTSFPKAFRSMENYTVKGGYALLET